MTDDRPTAPATPTAEREREAQLARDLEWLRERYGPPQPRAPQAGQLGLPLDGEDDQADRTADDAVEVNDE